MELGGIHHVTAVTADAPGNLEFYTRALGLRLVKKTVNQDDVSAYHLFYADAAGSPGTEMTFFDWRWAPPHEPGAGQVSATAFAVPDEESLGWWGRRLEELGVPRGEIREEGRRAVLDFSDPEGQRLRLVYDGAGEPPEVRPWEKGPVPAGRSLRGFDSVELAVWRLGPTEEVLVGRLGFRKVAERSGEGPRSAVYEVGPGGPGARVVVVERRDLPLHRRVGAGGVHHVAFRVPDEEEHRAWRERLARAGLGVTPVIDRYYFKSVYFREPGGVLFELATDGPGFAVDEDPERLGERLALPPFLEPHREQIERGLRPLPTAAGARSGE
ncbi:Glyoxalase/bleomycin resistance protein/dioxygenase [Rubrobacter xylanophilus DSM 9941]|uniref:Glyoxalase/bleomycin resistance protein/dioxygenase n=1 Tax=Rubrobacter xylanophilus (strain DSM 9941 / JCM 11954 / NBRC 16129 / PRD-1) TaxID=266117 RepID=Q1AX55_RUBXD|nr:ring-cleaving dioxygenase [Rubrobacter xylanophilus]ABG04023.1 Glyoxalase/bleomycin resistance protein/dioxygenase [Rubrobacter xylanophilus DSM 9941]